MKPRLTTFFLAASLTLGATACEQLKPLFETEPTREEIYAMKLAKGDAALQGGDFDQAITIYKDAATYTINDPTPTKALAKIYMQLGDTKQAMLAFRQVLIMSASDLESQSDLAGLYFQEGNYAAAATQYRQLVNSAAGQPDADQVRKLAFSLIRSGKSDEASPLIERVDALDPGNPETIVLKGELAIAQGNEDDGVERLDEALRTGGNSAVVHLTRARYFLKKDNAEAAASELTAAASIKPSDPEITALQMQALLKLERYSEAAEILTPLLQSRPSDLRLMGYMAEIKLMTGAPDAARELTDIILAESKNNPQALMIRARAVELTKPDDPMAAIGAYNQLIALHPNHVGAHHRLWSLLLKQDNKTEAVSVLERLLNLDQATDAEKIALAELYVETALELPRAQRLVDEALKNNPGDSRLLELSQKIKTRRKEIPSRGSNRGSGIQVLKGGR